MSPLEIRRLVGHPDIVERLRETTMRMANDCSVSLLLWGPHSCACLEATAEIERLRGTLRAVRGCSDPAWAARLINEALGETTP